MRKVQSTRKRRIVRNIAIYAAGAWGAIEFIDFSVTRYGLNSNFLDIAMLLAIIGSLFVIVLGWYHGEPGRQKIPPSEMVLLTVLTLSAAIGSIAIGLQDPFEEFTNADGFRLTVAFRAAPPGQSGEYGVHMSDDDVLSSVEAAKNLAETMFLMSPSEFRLDIPGVHLLGEQLPVRFIEAEQDEFNRMVIVLPSRPEDLDSLLRVGIDHEQARIESLHFTLQIDRAFRIDDQDDSATIKIKGPFGIKEDAGSDTSGDF